MRCALFLPLFGLATVILGLLSSIAALFDRSGRTSHHFARYWSRFIFWGVGIRVHVIGAENIPKDHAVIFAGNHQSTIDIPAMFGYLPAQFRIMAKQILFTIPFLGWHLYLAGNIPIDRKNTKKAQRGLLKAASGIRRNVSLFVFVEGTRTRDGLLRKFKRGSFTLAKKLNVPIVPVAIMGTFELMPAGSILARPGDIYLKIMPMIDVSQEAKIEDLSTAVRKHLLDAGLRDSEVKTS
ncbi:1-acyl-sn-glycerol-3-phosphate acyltransferase [bacterium]|nr:1-acyl-sn-glycerol-3-phosphate acyltransferase [bacterium]MCI0604409.1 1-acyl-sn-glycerol-3-phosphate acyltransferase [bacterium]